MKKLQKALQASNEIPESEYERMAVPFVPSNMEKNNYLACKNFIAWCNAQNAANPDNKCHKYKVLFDVDALPYWLHLAATIL